MNINNQNKFYKMIRKDKTVWINKISPQNTQTNAFQCHQSYLELAPHRLAKTIMKILSLTKISLLYILKKKKKSGNLVKAAFKNGICENRLDIQQFLI